MRRQLLILCCAWALCAAPAPSAGAEAAPAEEYPISLTVALMQDGGKYALAMTLTNRGPRTIRMVADSLPWAFTGFGAMVEMRLARPLYQRLTDTVPVGHNLDLVELAPGQSLSGRFPLSGRFLKLGDALEEEDVMYFWAYRGILMPDDLKGQVTPTNLITGWGLISKAGRK